MSDQLKFFTFYENWRDLADGRDTDEKRLVFYDTIMKYAFDGIVPPRPVKGISKGVEWAAWDAYNAVRPVIDVCRAKAEAGRKGGSRGGDSKARYGNSNASLKTQAKTQAENASKRKQKRKHPL